MTAPEPDLRCSHQAVELGDSLVGSAGHDDHYLLVELPLPWPKSIEQHPLLAGLDTPPPGAGSTRVLALLSDRPSPTDLHRVIAYRGGDGTSFSHYERHEGVFHRDELVEVIDAVVAGELDILEPVDDGMVDLLVCTHGSRDRCCGSEGARLFLDLMADPPENTRLWRTSHTGGHRFAPVALTFPDGFSWGRVNGDLLRGIVEQTLEPDEVAEQNRGSMGFADPSAQAADAEALAAVGWDWLTTERTAEVSTAPDTDHRVVEIGGATDVFRVTVEQGAPVPVPVCGEPIEASTKSSRPLRIVAVERVDD